MGLFTSLRSFFSKDKKEKDSEKVKFVNEDRESVKSLSSDLTPVSDTNISSDSYQLVKKRSEGIIEEKDILWEMNKKLNDLLEIKELYKDMLDWMVELNRNKENLKNRDSSRDVSIESSIESSLSPRLRQVVEIVEEKGELGASELSSEIGLSHNRCSELLNALYKSKHLSKNRVGRKVYYRVNNN